MTVLTRCFFLFLSLFVFSGCMAEESGLVSLKRVGSDTELLQKAYATYVLFKETGSPYALSMSDRASVPFEAFQARAQQEMNLPHLPFVGIWLIERDDSSIGAIEIAPVDLGGGYIEIGVFTLKDRAQSGDAEKAMRMIFEGHIQPYIGKRLKLVSLSSTGFSIEEKEFRGLLASIDPHNTPSLIVFTRLGFSLGAYKKSSSINSKNRLYLYNPAIELSKTQANQLGGIQKALKMMTKKETRGEGIERLEALWSELPSY